MPVLIRNSDKLKRIKKPVFDTPVQVIAHLKRDDSHTETYLRCWNKQIVKEHVHFTQRRLFNRSGEVVCDIIRYDGESINHLYFY